MGEAKDEAGEEKKDEKKEEPRAEKKAETPAEKKAEPRAEKKAETPAEKKAEPRAEKKAEPRKEVRGARASEPSGEGAMNLPLVALALLVAAGAGVAVGWFARGRSGGAQPAAAGTGAVPGQQGPADSPGTAGGGACADWAKKICAAEGEESATCKASGAAAEIMPRTACEAALAEVAASLAKVKVVRRPCHDLQAKLCGDLGDEAACDWARDNLLSRFPPEGCTEVMEGRYAELLGYVRQRQDQIRREEAQKKPLPGEVARKIATEGSPPAFGPVDARVVMVEFSDFQCPYCQRAGRAVERLRARYSGVIRFVFRQYPLPADTHPQADLCAQAALAAHAQDRFWDYHDLMFEEQPRLREGRPVLEELAEKIGLEMTAFRAALDGQQFRGTIDQEKALGEEAFVNGTPSIFIDGRRVKDPYSAASMSQEINDALTAAGVPIPPEPPPAPPAQPAADAAGPAPDAS